MEHNKKNLFSAIKIIFEDEHMVVIDKPSGLLVHEDGKKKEPTLVDWILEKYPAVAEVGEPEIVDGKELMRPGIVHRLDKETSGVLAIAKTIRGYRHMKRAFKNREARKQYVAVVYGKIKIDRGFIDLPIGKDPHGGKLSAARALRGIKREAETAYRVVARSEEATYLEVFPKTGRTHQIRVHLKALQHPVIADSLYAPGRPRLFDFTRLALHAERLTLPMPDGGAKEFIAPVPEEFTRALAKLKSA